MREKDFEDVLDKYPVLIEPGLKRRGRQVVMYGRRMDLLFEDVHGNKLIVELKVGPIKDEHLGQILSYEGMILSAEDPTVRVMLVATRVPLNIRKALDHHGIAWKELKITQLREYLASLNDSVLLSRIREESDQPDPVLSATKPSRRVKHTPPVNQIVSRQPIDEFACNHCRLSLWKLREMAEVGGNKEVFTTLRRDRPMNIYEVTDDGFLIMRRSTGRITTWALDIYTLRRVHDLVHAGDIDLDAREIESVKINGTKKAATWGTYIAALLKHLECHRISEYE